MTATELNNFSKIILLKLTIELKNGRITAQNPIKGQELISAYNKRYGSDYKLPDLREAINHLRCQGEPIGSGAGSDGGYFYCANESEWQKTRVKLLERIKSQQRAADAPSLRFKTQNEKQEFPIEHPVVEALKSEFQAVEVG